MLWPTELKRRVSELTVSEGAGRTGLAHVLNVVFLKPRAKVQQKYEMREVKSEKFADFNDFLSQTP